MATEFKLRTRVLPGHRIEVTAPELNEGDLVDVRVTVTDANGAEPESAEDPLNAWEYLRKYAGTLEMPEDWSGEHDHYLYGSPKRSERSR